jgi:polysaccharide export outer membrane protein
MKMPPRKNKGFSWLLCVAASSAVLVSGCGWIPMKEGVFKPADESTASGADDTRAHAKTSKGGSASTGTEMVPDPSVSPKQFFHLPLIPDCADDKQLADFSSSVDNSYHIGPGDKLNVMVRRHPDVSRLNVTVSPDGKIELPRIGIIDLNRRTVQDAINLITLAVSNLYDSPQVSLEMLEFNNSKVFILGRVPKPGAYNLSGSQSLIELLTQAGGLETPKAGQSVSTGSPFDSPPQRCAVTRGKNLIIWVNLRHLLDKGDMALNVKLQAGDSVLVPATPDNAYIMGEVGHPGLVTITPKTTLLSAIMTAGGPLMSCNIRSIFLIRHSEEGQGIVQKFNMADLVGKANNLENYIVQSGDVIYLPMTGIARFNFFCGLMTPFSNMIGVANQGFQSAIFYKGIKNGTF